MSDYRFKVRTYAYDSSGYYIGQGDELTVTLIAGNTVEAREKALKMREGDGMRGTANKWRAVVLSAEEVVDEPILASERNTSQQASPGPSLAEGEE